MSYKLFDQGYTAEEVSKMHKPTQEEKLREQTNKWKESEQVLEVLRQIKGFPRQLDKMEAALWQKATKRR
jgi:hypothetical protein